MYCVWTAFEEISIHGIVEQDTQIDEEKRQRCEVLSLFLNVAITRFLKPFVP